MTKLFSLGLAFLMALTVTGCELYFEDDDDDFDGPSPCEADGRCPAGGGNDCQDNDDCAAGCYCLTPPGTSSGKCEETGFCSKDSDCPEGFICDDRQSCVAKPRPPASCAGAIAPTCTNGAPRCPAGQVPLIADGCYVDNDLNGQFDCGVIAACEEEPSCGAFQYATDCDAAADPTTGAACVVVTKGINCTTPGGSACQDGQPGCTCAMYVYDSCR